MGVRQRGRGMLKYVFGSACWSWLGLLAVKAYHAQVPCTVKIFQLWDAVLGRLFVKMCGTSFLLIIGGSIWMLTTILIPISLSTAIAESLWRTCWKSETLTITKDHPERKTFHVTRDSWVKEWRYAFHWWRGSGPFLSAQNYTGTYLKIWFKK